MQEQTRGVGEGDQQGIVQETKISPYKRYMHKLESELESIIHKRPWDYEIQIKPVRSADLV